MTKKTQPTKAQRTARPAVRPAPKQDIALLARAIALLESLVESNRNLLVGPPMEREGDRGIPLGKSDLRNFAETACVGPIVGYEHRAVASAIAELNQAARSVRESLQDLLEHLSPVLRAATNDCPSGSGMLRSSNACKISDEIFLVASDLHGLKEMIVDATERLEL